MNPEAIAVLCSELTLLKFFPSEQGARTALFLLIGRMCSNEDQVRYLVRRTLALCNEWPGPVVLRQILCCKYKPADGIEAGGTASFPDGVPSEKRIEAPAVAALPPGHVATADRQLDAAVKLLAASKDLNRKLAPRGIPKDSISPERRAELQAQIDQAVFELRDKRARAELGEVAE